jgi:NAD(P)-dependent dehydrogenase (short-subunit alcohol dehydrogenase family)
MDLGIRGKVAIVTGASEGIGKAISLELAKEGAKIVMCARRKKVLELAREEIIKKSNNKDILAIKCDVTKKEELKNLVDETVKMFETIHIIVNNAGKRLAKSIEDVTEEDWEYDINLKLLAAYRLSKLAIPFMKKNKWGRIVNITAVIGKQPQEGSLPTSVTRAAGIALTKAMSKDLAKYNITVNTICLGKIKSMQWVRSWKESNCKLSLNEFYKNLAKGIPLGRVGEAEEVAYLAAFLCSERASYITGAAINIDGGLSAVV